MMTLRQIERYWQAKAYDRLIREILAGRPEASVRLETELTGSAPAAALALIRLDELGQAHAFLCTQMVRSLLTQQQADGGWGDVMVTALCVRALACAQGSGLSIQRGIAYLANLQKPDGFWPRIPIRRTPADPYVSAMVLFQLGDNAEFRQAVRFADALKCFEPNEPISDPQTQRLWQRAAFKCRLHQAPKLLWS